MRNITISMDEDLALWVRVEAARRDTSMSRFVSSLLRDLMQGDREYEQAMKSNLRRKPRKLSSAGRYPTRDEIHER